MTKTHERKGNTVVLHTASDSQSLRHCRKLSGKKRKKATHRLLHSFSALFLLCFAVAAVFHFTSVSASADVPERYKYYTNVYVDRDTTLWDVSNNYISDEYSDIRAYMDEVKSINHLPDDQLVYGTTICVPYYSDDYRK